MAITGDTTPPWLDSLSEEWISETVDPANTTSMSIRTTGSVQVHRVSELGEESNAEGVEEGDSHKVSDLLPEEQTTQPSTMYVDTCTLVG